MRSNFEREVALFLGDSAKYERTTLQVRVPYTPDFEYHHHDGKVTYLELKGRPHHHSELQKILALSRQLDRNTQRFIVLIQSHKTRWNTKPLWYWFVKNSVSVLVWDYHSTAVVVNTITDFDCSIPTIELTY